MCPEGPSTAGAQTPCDVWGQRRNSGTKNRFKLRGSGLRESGVELLCSWLVERLAQNS